MKWTLINQAGTNDPDTGDIYSGLDRFGRVKDNRWIDGEGDDLDRIQYGYDRASNRIWRKNVVAAALGKQFDELYTYDGVHRLKDMVRGTLNGGHTALTSDTFAESWTLDSTGNWRGFKQDDNGDGTWSLIQSRAANPVNVITDIAESVGPSWVTPAYNRAGNMTTMPQPAAPTASYTATYDAWNRLVKIADGAETVSEYVYDGAKRRIVQKSYDGGVLDETRHLYYTEPALWQVIEERVGTSPDSADAERQFIWGNRYIDDLVVRDRDTDGEGSLTERLYACQDANWNVTATITEDVQERYAYSAYGKAFVLTAAFDPCGHSGVEMNILFCGYQFQAKSMLLHIRNRVLHFLLGAFVQRDNGNGSRAKSLYEYVNSMPLSYLDPTGNDAYPMPVPVPPEFPADGGTRGGGNGRTWLGFNCGPCERPKPWKDRVTPISNSGPMPSPAPTGPSTGHNTWYGMPFSGPIGGNGSAGCIILVIQCDNGAAVYHFTPGDDPWSSLGFSVWSGSTANWSGCSAMVCGGYPDDPASDCLADDVIDAVGNLGMQLVGVSGGQGCGFNTDGTWYEVP